MARDGSARAAARLCVYSLGFAGQPVVRAMLRATGWRLGIGWPRAGDAVGVWGRKPVAARGLWVAGRAGVPVVTLEDGFLRSVRPGIGPPLSLLIDDLGVHYDPTRPSRLEQMIAEGEPEPERARAGIETLHRLRLSKYNALTGPAPEGGYVLVIDQTRRDASVAASGADAATFRRMLDAARSEHAGQRIVIRTHPDVAARKRGAHLTPADLRAGEIIDANAEVWALIEGASAVYTVSSLMGFEALMAGKPVRCFGRPFYAGWGLTEDEDACPRRTPRTLAALFTASHLRFPVYHDPWHGQPCGFERAVERLGAAVEAWRATPRPVVATAMRSWKRAQVARFLTGVGGSPRFVEPQARAVEVARQQGRDLVVWAGKAQPDLAATAAQAGVSLVRMEDGFLRSVGLGAALVPAASVVTDRRGIYFDPTRESDLEHLIAGPPPPPEALERAARLRAAISAGGVSKYNLGRPAPLPPRAGRRTILVPGQVADDASVRLGGAGHGNLSLLEAVRKANPEAFLVWKPHPDVEAGLRAGHVAEEAVARLADHVARGADPAALLAEVDAVWTISSLMGFEALLRGRPVTVLGQPFYAGWGLTQDLAPIPRRTARPTLDHLVWAALIAYPRYLDPVTGLPCTPELVLERLSRRTVPRRPAVWRGIARLQSLWPGPPFWR